ncbi:LysR family transcriptional regulator [Shewanella glacialipiscicola]|uniref:LysR family transcriptional regulator n=1 Tax=Shewanella glacialipiscicola TaxID=614069 RepID=A0ABQ6J416_9GAMM|nr:LysR family transcriptional regulator [Shewanella glacialipiscicola]MCL1085904.1 LysR family transcriptional regulator [Shewanella glacialipiscicola]MCU7993380.1 LysR family transcriptional regulator [Shewanella glacialipiscicola]MCU8024697.1 LysR family transcriptional regulator [Shewanella glacialipiscicola]GIU10074.1 LysR family transcriptional regulator [Shewanella glacialipiscicola]GMA81994.1 LysR family transcriptional regulator [Shewanella glacialipiscicola]
MTRAKSTLEQWRILQAVVDFGGYAQAAEKLNKSQSSLNHAVAKLQHQLGIDLLEVKGRKAYLTQQGEVLLRRSRHVTQAVSELEQLASNLEQGWEPTLTIAREIIYPMESLVCALNAFLPDSRGTRIIMLDSVITGTQEHILQNKVDIAICAGTPPKGYLSEPLCEQELFLVCHPSHPLADLGIIEDDKLLAQHLQLVIKDTGVQSNADIGWLKAEQRWTVSNFHEAKVILNQGIGFCWIPSFLIQTELSSGYLVRLHLSGNQKRRIMLSLVIPDRDQQGPASKLLTSLILKQHGIETTNSNH